MKRCSIVLPLTFLVFSVLVLTLFSVPVLAQAGCSKEGDPGLYVDFGEDYHDIPVGQALSWTVGPCNFGFVSWPCPDTDTFCVHAYMADSDAGDYTVTGDPYLDDCYLIDPGYLWWQDINVTALLSAEVGSYDTLVVVVTYCDAEVTCRPDCGDCEDPNWYGGNPYYSSDTLILHVVEPPPELEIHQDSLTYVDEGQPAAYIPFEICNPTAVSPARDYSFVITSMGQVGGGFPQSGTVYGLEGAECETVYGVMDASGASHNDRDTLVIIAWDDGVGSVYDTCVQIIEVIEPSFVPLLSTPVILLLAIAMLLVAAVFIRRRSKQAGGALLISLILVCLTLLMTSSSDAGGRKGRDRPVIRKDWSRGEFSAILERGPGGLYRSASVDTYVIVRFDFEYNDWQGWTRVDNTAQLDTFFHVDDFAGLGGGDFGRLYPLEGTQSAWCGARPEDEITCGWSTPPGYGSYWDQWLVSDPFYFNGLLNLVYKMRIDTEEDWDEVHVEYDAGGLDWRNIAVYDGTDDIIGNHVLALPQYRTKFRVRFTSPSTWNDEDGLYNTDGACIVDSIWISDETGTIDYEDFESASVGALEADGDLNTLYWRADVPEPYGMYSDIWENLYQETDPCNDNLSRQIVFFAGSPHASTEYEGLYETPYCKDGADIGCFGQEEMVVSPPIDMTMYSSGRDEIQDLMIAPSAFEDLGGSFLRFSVYRDLPVINLVFYYWKVRDIDDGCPCHWRDNNFVYYGDFKEYLFFEQDISPYWGGGGIDSIQVALGVIDMCPTWYGVYGYCAAHTPSPWFDNVEIVRYEATGPLWTYRDLDLFQDNFPEEEFGLDSYVRADMARDIRPSSDPIIDPGDSIVVSCESPMGRGIAEDAFGPLVYMHVKCTYIGAEPAPTPINCWDLEGDYGHIVACDEVACEAIIQCDTARAGTSGVVPGKYMVDLNDSLLTRGHIIEYYFSAQDRDGNVTTLPRGGSGPGAGYLLSQGPDEWFEFTCLPTFTSDVLFVDDFSGRGSIGGVVEDYWTPTLEAVLSVQPDRYDVNGASSCVSNGLGGRAKCYHLTTAYSTIIWDSGDLDVCTICDGTTHSDKGNDCLALVAWMDFSPHDVGLWVCGDNIARDLDASLAACPTQLTSTMCGVCYVHGSYFDMTGGRYTGGVMNPLVEACEDVYNPLWHTTWGDSFYVLSGCPYVEDLDCLEKTGSGDYALAYPDHEALPYYAGIYSTGINDGGYEIRTMWFGFSLMLMKDAELSSPIMRNIVAKDVLGWMDGDTNSVVTGDEETPPVYRYGLAQNYPNPFNPATTIRFGMKERGHVTLKVYDVTGRLVKTLVNGVREAGPHRVTWRGENNSGSDVASGIYFYRMRAGDFTGTRKMILMR